MSAIKRRVDALVDEVEALDRVDDAIRKKQGEVGDRTRELSALQARRVVVLSRLRDRFRELKAEPEPGGARP